MNWRRLLGALVFIFCVEVVASACPFNGPFCVLTYHMRNLSRHVHDDFMDNECPGQGLHSKPFGNWGVHSPENQVPEDRDQFQGWKDFTNPLEKDNQWNSCTSRQDLYPEGNCDFYNHDSCTAQITDKGTNQYTNTFRQHSEPVSCFGGCSDLNGEFYVLPNEWLKLYELDLGENWSTDPDAFVDKLLAPPLLTPLPCYYFNSCFPAASAPVPAISVNGADIFANVWVQLLGGGYEDPYSACDFGNPLP